MSLQHVIDAVRAQPAIVLGVIAVALVCVCLMLAARIDRLKDRLHVAQAAAEDAAKAAALASPGGIDPEVVVELLRVGKRPTLDSVYAGMQRRSGQRPR